MSQRLLMLEFHDATFGGLNVDRSFIIRLQFLEIVCYYTSDVSTVAEVWTCPGELQVDGSSQLIIECPIHDAASVSSFDMTPEAPSDPYGLALLKGKWIDSAYLRMEGNGSILIKAGMAKLTLGKRRELLERVDWPCES